MPSLRIFSSEYSVTRKRFCCHCFSTLLYNTPLEIFKKPKELDQNETLHFILVMIIQI